MAIAVGKRILASDMASLAALAAAKSVPGAPYSFPTTNLYTNPATWRTELQRLHDNLLPMFNLNPYKSLVSGPQPLNNPAGTFLTLVEGVLTNIDFYYANTGSNQILLGIENSIGIYADSWTLTSLTFTLTVGGDQAITFFGGTCLILALYASLPQPAIGTGTTTFPGASFLVPISYPYGSWAGEPCFVINSDVSVPPGTYTFSIVLTQGNFGQNGLGQSGAFLPFPGAPTNPQAIYNTTTSVPGIHSSKSVAKVTGPRNNSTSGLPPGVYDSSVAGMAALGTGNNSGFYLSTSLSGYFFGLCQPRMATGSNRGDLMPWNKPTVGWLPATQVTAGQQIIDSYGLLRIAVNSGLTGTTEPNWTQTTIFDGVTYLLASVVDGSVFWRYVPFTLSTWHIGTTYPLYAIIMGNNYVQTALVAGLSDDTTPAWSSVIGSGVTDNQIHWFDQILPLFTWSSGATVYQNQPYMDSHGTVYIAQNPGETGSVIPTFNQTGTTTDGTVTWQSCRAPLSNFFPSCPRYPYTVEGTADSTALPGWSRAFNPVGWWIESVFLHKNILADTQWAPTSTWPAGTYLNDSNGCLQCCVQTGVSGGSAPTWATSGCTRTYDQKAAWVMLSVGSWASITAYLVGQPVEDTNGNLQICTQGGISGRAAPSWSTSVGGTTNDGTLIWTMQSVAAWIANTTWTVGQYLKDLNGNFQICVQSGTGGTSVPTWSTVIDGRTTDGTNVWVNIEVSVTLGCMRSGAFVSFGTYQTGQNPQAELWWPIFTANSLVYSCAEVVDVQATLFNMQGTMSNYSYINPVFLNFPLRASHYNDLESLLNVL